MKIVWFNEQLFSFWFQIWSRSFIEIIISQLTHFGIDKFWKKPDDENVVSFEIIKFHLKLTQYYVLEHCSVRLLNPKTLFFSC